MAEISKPAGLNIQWASAGDILDPGDTKYQTGWEVEIPPRQWENYIQNKQDKFIAHVNQHGVVVWDSVTEYQTDKSYVQGATNGIVYRCVLTHTNQDPELDVANTYWVVAFAEADTTYTKTESDGLYLAKAQNLADLVSTSTARTNLSVYSKTETDTRNLNSTRIDVASGTTVDLTTLAPNTRHINITGTTTINGFTVVAGATYFVRFNAALTLTNSASLVTQSGANILTAAGDTCIIRATAANTVEVLCGRFLVERGVGTGQTWQNLLASRATGVVYTNTTGRTISVSIGVIPAGTRRELQIDGVLVYESSNSASAREGMFSPVPNGSTYTVTGGTLQVWSELR